MSYFLNDVVHVVEDGQGEVANLLCVPGDKIEVKLGIRDKTYAVLTTPSKLVWEILKSLSTTFTFVIRLKRSLKVLLTPRLCQRLTTEARSLACSRWKLSESMAYKGRLCVAGMLRSSERHAVLRKGRWSEKLLTLLDFLHDVESPHGNILH